MGGMLFAGVDRSVLRDKNRPAEEFLAVKSHIGTHAVVCYR